MRKVLLILLVLEIAVMIAVVFVFRTIENRFHAGLVAGSLFILLGMAIVGRGWNSPEFRRVPTFAVGCLHLFGVALPMIIIRVLNADSDFREIPVWGLPGPVFHKLSEGVYLLLLLVTAFDAYRSWHWEKSA
jgi:hypothetical protein